MIGPRHLTDAQRKLVDSYQRYGVEAGSSSPCVWAALECMRADLPPAGPADVEVEVFWMFDQWDIRSHSAKGRGRKINGRVINRGRAVWAVSSPEARK